MSAIEGESREMPSQSYQDLIGWQKSMALVGGIYRCTQSFPKEEIYEFSVACLAHWTEKELATCH